MLSYPQFLLLIVAVFAGCAGSGSLYDFDGDGVPDEEDCASSDPLIYPGAEDLFGDDIDQDCDGVDGDAADQDQDGYPSGVDCDDNDSSIHPGAADEPGDGIDQNCDGLDGILGDDDDATSDDDDATGDDDSVGDDDDSAGDDDDSAGDDDDSTDDRCADGTVEGSELSFARSDIAFCASADQQMPASKTAAALLCGASGHLCSALEYRARNDACSDTPGYMSGWLSDGENCVARTRDSAGSACFADGTHDTDSGSCPQHYDGGWRSLEAHTLVGLQGASCSAGSLGCGAFCCSDAPTPGDGSSASEPALNCSELYLANSSLPSGNYWVDPDGPGGVAPVLVQCELGVGPEAWMTAANIIDTAFNDMPNTPSTLHLGSRFENGSLHTGPGTVAVSSQTPWSTVVGFDFVVAAAASGYGALKMCFFRQGVEMACRSSLGSAVDLLSLVARPAGSYLDAYDQSPLLYTFGRLVGVPGTGNTYAEVTWEAHCILRTTGGAYFGSDSQGLCEITSQGGTAPPGVWHGWGWGCVYHPWGADDAELANCDADQFVLYLGRN